jgi:hypothetical protein
MDKASGQIISCEVGDHIQGLSEDESGEVLWK